MGYSLNSLKRGHIRDFIGNYLGAIKEDTRSLDYGSHGIAKRSSVVWLGFRSECSEECTRLESLVT